MRTLIYTAEVTEVLTDEEYENNVPHKNLKEFKIGDSDIKDEVDDRRIENEVRKALDVDSVVITKVQVFEHED